MWNDPIALATEGQDALERFGGVGACLQYGEGWSCTQSAMPDGPPRLIGHDDRGNEVWMYRYLCVAGHRYHLETPAPDREVVDGSQGQAMTRAGASAS